MRPLQRWIVDVLEIGCRATRLVEWVPGWNRLYQCDLAKWSNELDARWGTERWPVHESTFQDWDDWGTWWDSLSDDERLGGHWHSWLTFPFMADRDGNEVSMRVPLIYRPPRSDVQASTASP
jgi:hypothetical protein